MAEGGEQLGQDAQPADLSQQALAQPQPPVSPQLVLTERYSWQLILVDGVSLNLGREDRIQRVQRFMDAYRQIKAFAQDDMQVDYIDLRYDTGMAVGWKPVINELEKQKEQKTNA